MRLNDQAENQPWIKNQPSFISALVLSFFLAIFASGSADAADAASKNASSKYKTKKAVAMSQPVFKKLEAAQKLIEEQKYAAAIKLMQNLRSRKK